ncbi:hypothetical protein BU16DRAFT_563930 [Lophium mytilinum]|uniref:Uncharacterized protein n=1 Tax=Lophium mytilinum TaxID=390894 RepID=A0A6A6QK23_9PEZI|nr:hypothetical protein BU16DRAFT_563930 [Lophium mytilinum]
MDASSEGADTLQAFEGPSNEALALVLISVGVDPVYALRYVGFHVPDEEVEILAVRLTRQVESDRLADRIRRNYREDLERQERKLRGSFEAGMQDSENEEAYGADSEEEEDEEGGIAGRGDGEGLGGRKEEKAEEAPADHVEEVGKRIAMMEMDE